jgi:hypothetical protein
MTTTEDRATATTFRPHGRTTGLALGTALGLALAVGGDLVVHLLGNLGAPVQTVTGWAPDGADLRVAEVVITAATAVVLGTAALWLMQRRGADRFGLWVRLAVGTAVVSALPLLRLEVDAGSKVTLVAMHLVTGAAAIAGHAVARRRQAAVANAAAPGHEGVRPGR